MVRDMYLVPFLGREISPFEWYGVSFFSLPEDIPLYTTWNKYLIETPVQILFVKKIVNVSEMVSEILLCFLCYSQQ